MRTACESFTVVTFSLVCAFAAAEDRGEPPVSAPFEKLDTLCVEDWWNRPPSKIVDLRVPRDRVIGFALYTVAEGRLKLTAQLYPLYPDESREVTLEIDRGDGWRRVANQAVNDLGWNTTFRVEDWDHSRDAKYRLRHPGGATYEGLVRKDPADQDEIVVAALSCNSNKDRGLRPNYVRNLRHQDPDLVFFAGDQSYDHREHTAAWLKFGEQFREVFRDRPCVTIPDDHDVGQGNLWGEEGVRAPNINGNDGGYFCDPLYVQMVERTQCGHLPDPYDPTPIKNGIGVYYTSLRVGGVDFAILEDRKFKTGPRGEVPRRGGRPGVDYDPSIFDLPGLQLLGQRQLDFLRDWSTREGVAMRCVLSQTGFANTAHLSGGPTEKNRLWTSFDSNGWPQAGRRKALELIRAAGAVHIGGDQHLSTLVQHGIDRHGDGPWAFLVPAIVNDYWARWWRPYQDAAGENRDPSNPLPWTGEFDDGFGNPITMHAYANPDAPSNGAGYGLVRFHLRDCRVTFECWPREADVRQADAEQFVGWPVTVRLP